MDVSNALYVSNGNKHWEDNCIKFVKLPIMVARMELFHVLHPTYQCDERMPLLSMLISEECDEPTEWKLGTNGTKDAVRSADATSVLKWYFDVKWSTWHVSALQHSNWSSVNSSGKKQGQVILNRLSCMNDSSCVVVSTAFACHHSIRTYSLILVAWCRTFPRNRWWTFCCFGEWTLRCPSTRCRYQHEGIRLHEYSWSFMNDRTQSSCFLIQTLWWMNASFLSKQWFYSL